MNHSSAGSSIRIPSQTVAARPRGFWVRCAKWAQQLLGALMLLAFCRYLWLHRGEFRELLDVSGLELSLLVGLIVLSQVLNTAQSWVLLRAAGVSPSFAETFLVNCASNFGNYLPMRAGSLVRAHFLKEVYGLSYARFGSMFGVRSIITLFGTGLFGVIGTLAVAWTGHRLSIALLAGFTLMLAAAAVAWALPAPASPRGLGVVGRILGDVLEGARELRGHPAAGSSVLLLTLVQQVLLAGRFYVATRGSSVEAPVALLFLLSPVATLATFVAWTPGALGFREAAMGGVTYAVGTAFSSGILLGTVDRTMLLLVVAVLGLPSFILVWARLRRLQRSEAAPGQDEAGQT